jgi:hypothetical protein
MSSCGIAACASLSRRIWDHIQRNGAGGSQGQHSRLGLCNRCTDYQFTDKKDGLMGKSTLFKLGTMSLVGRYICTIFHNLELSLELPRVNSKSLFG